MAATAWTAAVPLAVVGSSDVTPPRVRGRVPSLASSTRGRTPPRMRRVAAKSAHHWDDIATSQHQEVAADDDAIESNSGSDADEHSGLRAPAAEVSVATSAALPKDRRQKSGVSFAAADEAHLSSQASAMSSSRRDDVGSPSEAERWLQQSQSASSSEMLRRHSSRVSAAASDASAALTDTSQQQAHVSARPVTEADSFESSAAMSSHTAVPSRLAAATSGAANGTSCDVHDDAADPLATQPDEDSTAASHMGAGNEDEDSAVDGVAAGAPAPDSIVGGTVAVAAASDEEWATMATQPLSQDAHADDSALSPAGESYGDRVAGAVAQSHPTAVEAAPRAGVPHAASRHPSDSAASVVLVDSSLDCPPIPQRAPPSARCGAQHNCGIGAARVVLRATTVAPTTAQLIATLPHYGLPEIAHPEPRFSRDDDVPERPRVFAGIQFKIPGE